MEKTRKSGEDAKLKGEGKVGAAGKREKYPWFLFFLFCILFCFLCSRCLSSADLTVSEPGTT